MKVTLKQAIDLVSELREELNNEISDIKRTPLKVDGKPVIRDSELEEAEERYNRISDLTEDIVTVRSAIQKANVKTDTGKLIVVLQENNKLIDTLKHSRLIQGKETNVVPGSGVVEEGIPEEDTLRNVIDTRKRENNEIQTEIDKHNQEVTVNLDLNIRIK